eukprot:689836-Pleurochrysis_carterae.AAC.1
MTRFVRELLEWGTPGDTWGRLRSRAARCTGPASCRLAVPHRTKQERMRSGGLQIDEASADEMCFGAEKKQIVEAITC